MPATPDPWQYSPETLEIRAADTLIAAQVQANNAPLIITAWRMLAALKLLAQQARLSVKQREQALSVIADAEGRRKL